LDDFEPDFPGGARADHPGSPGEEHEMVSAWMDRWPRGWRVHPIMRVWMPVWTSTASEIQRLPAIREVAG